MIYFIFISYIKLSIVYTELLDCVTYDFQLYNLTLTYMAVVTCYITRYIP